ETRREAAKEAGMPADVDSYVMTSMRVLRDGEDPYGDAARDAMGHIALALLTFAADNPSFAEGLDEEERDAVQRLLDRRGTTATAQDRHNVLYTNYLGRIRPEERDLVVPSLVDKLGLVGTRDQLAERIAAMEEAGIDEIVLQPVIDPPAEMAEFAALTAWRAPAPGPDAHRARASVRSGRPPGPDTEPVRAAGRLPAARTGSTFGRPAPLGRGDRRDGDPDGDHARLLGRLAGPLMEVGRGTGEQRPPVGAAEAARVHRGARLDLVGDAAALDHPHEPVADGVGHPQPALGVEADPVARDLHLGEDLGDLP